MITLSTGKDESTDILTHTGANVNQYDLRGAQFHTGHQNCRLAYSLTQTSSNLSSRNKKSSITIRMCMDGYFRLLLAPRSWKQPTSSVENYLTKYVKSMHRILHSFQKITYLYLSKDGKMSKTWW